MDLRIALAGNPNSGKTTLFNALTGSNQFVGNWPGVTVEKKEGKLKRQGSVIVTDLPGIYSLSPYTPEEVVARKYLVEERPDAILNIVDGTNIERNLYLTTQLCELGIPVVIAINMMDVVRRNGDTIDIAGLSHAFGCPVVEISALKSEGVNEAAEAAIEAAKDGKLAPQHIFSGTVEHALAHIEEATVHHLPKNRQRWYAVKIFERDERVLAKLQLSPETLAHIEEDIVAVERELDDDAEAVITNERYLYIERKLKSCFKKKSVGRRNLSAKIDNVLTNRFAALPIFALIMFLVYFISVSTVGAWATDWANDGLFGDGFHLFGIGAEQYEEALDSYAEEHVWSDQLTTAVEIADNADVAGAGEILSAVQQKDFVALRDAWESFGPALLAFYGEREGAWLSDTLESALENAPATEEYGVWVPGIPVLLGRALAAMNAADWAQSLVLDGIVGGVGAVLGFVPQILVLFLMLSFLEACGYMSRIAFVMDRIFRKFGLSGKSFIPMLVGTGCSVPGIMASRTIENDRDRRMTVITTSFVPCGAKLPVIALIASALFEGAWWVAPTAYFVGIAAVVVSGLILKKTKLFAGDPAPFVMELPDYHMPTAQNLLRATWERGWAFIKKAGTIILLSTIVIWTVSHFGVVDGHFAFDIEMELANSLLGYFGKGVKWLFIPLGFGSIETAAATFMGLVAKEEIVAVLGVLDFADMGRLAAFSFLIFNLLCAPCIAAMSAIRREMNSGKWTLFAIAYQCVLAYAVSLIVYQLGMLFVGQGSVPGAIAAVLLLVGFGYLLFRPYEGSKRSEKEVRIKKS